MRTVNKVAVVDGEKCTACGTCVGLCPVEAIVLAKQAKKRSAAVDETMCLACTICMTRCPEHAISMAKRESPLQVGVDMSGVSKKEIARICQNAHMLPEQIICYCHRVQAQEVAAAILQGAQTPEDIARATAARTGCGVLCITGIIRLLRAAGVDLTEAPGWQWYGLELSVWEVSPEIIQKYSQYYLAEDLRDVNRVFPGGGKSS